MIHASELADRSSLDEVLSLLAACGLPEAGLREAQAQVLVVRDGSRRVLASAALEAYPPVALLRSVAVDAAHRESGLGSTVVEAALAHARQCGIDALYLLTETAPGFFARRGFQAIDRARVPEAIQHTTEFRGVCCAAALVMVRDLGAPSGDVGVRAALGTDAEAIGRIYNEGIEDRVGTFETRLRTANDVRAWFDGVHPVVVATLGGRVVGFGATSSYRPARACYTGIAEFSVYVARDQRGCGLGRAIMLALVDVSARAGLRKLVSRVFVENAASRRLLASVGFREVGVYERHGKLDGAWRDVVIVERLSSDG